MNFKKLFQQFWKYLVKIFLMNLKKFLEILLYFFEKDNVMQKANRLLFG